MQPFRKTHPMVLTAAVAVTVFSILGSAAITGLIPSAHSGRAESMLPMTANESKSGVEPHRNETSHAYVSARDKPSLAGKDARLAAGCSTCGVIESIRSIEHEGDGSGLGAVAGGVVGGVAGNQMGKGTGNTLMTLLGIGGGAFAGHTIEKNMKTSTAFVVKVRMEDGTYRSVTQHSRPEYAVGDHVKLAHGTLISA